MTPMTLNKFSLRNDENLNSMKDSLQDLNFGYSFDSLWDYFYTQFILDRYSRKLDTQVAERTIETDTISAAEILDNFSDLQGIPTSYSTRILLCRNNEVLIKSETYTPDNTELYLYGDAKKVNEICNFLDEKYPAKKKYLDWVYNNDMEFIQLPVNFKPALNSAFPFLTNVGDSERVKTYIDSFIAADANILILIGPAGTGKTTLIKNIITQYKTTCPAIVTYDEKIMANDAFFAKFMSNDYGLMVVEDADLILQSRDSGNSLMQRFLNLGDGLISTKNKKIIFSTNLPNIRDIDAALLRPGRCFDVLQFRALTANEAKDVLLELGQPADLPFNAPHYTLAELVNRTANSNYDDKHSARFI